MRFVSTIQYCLFVGFILWSSLLFAMEPVNSYHGAECKTANDTQAQYFVWNKDGITNTSPIPLFVICPMSYEYPAFNHLNVPPVESMYGAISVSFGNGLSNDTRMTCYVRVSQSLDGSGLLIQGADTIFSNKLVLVGNFEYPGMGGKNGFGGWIGVPIFRSSATYSHLLCLLPQGSTLRGYSMGIR